MLEIDKADKEMYCEKLIVSVEMLGACHCEVVQRGPDDVNNCSCLSEISQFSSTSLLLCSTAV